jgi:DNA mismatch repair protein MutL
MTIERLDDDAVRRIAAGEVVTDPAAAVKELVENALDAGARSVEVTVENGGIDRIRVADDGRGIPPAEAPLAFERHATSKIRRAGDVDAVDTLGFRGEALSAIADAATVEMTTRAAGSAAVRLGPDGEPTPAARAEGTTVEVTDLFADRPARRESLASPRREFAKVSDLVASYALVHPSVGFALSHAEDRTFATPGSGSRVDAALGVYDRSVAGQATEFAHRDGEVAVEGLLCYPSVTRATHDHVYTAVSGRVVRDATVRSAVLDGYGGLLPPDRYPVAVVDVAVPPEGVDANVHPAKTAVAFADADAVTAAVREAVEDALATEDLTRSAEAAVDLEESVERLDADADAPLAELSVVGVFRDLYVLCEAGDRLLVVDGHAAHERVNFERLRAAVGEAVPSVAVDPPETVALSPANGAVLSDPEVREAVERAGFEAEPLGEGTCRVSAVPAPVGRAADPGAVRAVLSELRGGGDAADAVDDGLAELACHDSLKAGDGFDRETARRLVDSLAACERPYACPHGRPTVLSIEEATLARGFDRPNTRLG